MHASTRRADADPMRFAPAKRVQTMQSFTVEFDAREEDNGPLMLFDLRRSMHRRAARLLTAPLGSFPLSGGQDFDALRRTVKKGDVLLVAGNQRVSEVIRYLTQSSWSHSAIYVGDELLRGAPEQAAELEAQLGDHAHHMVVEALLESGVVASPLSKYTGYRVRLCRPFEISDEDRDRVVDLAIGHLGFKYDVANIFDLARYFLPVSIVPARFRREALHFGSGQATEVICSSMIANAFEAVGFPVLPRTEDTTDGYHADLDTSWPSRRPLARHLRLASHPSRLITPRDFDLSPYFEIVKFSLRDSARRAAETEATATTSRRIARVLPFFKRLAGSGDEDDGTERAAG